jgi:hypothetical protein
MPAWWDIPCFFEYVVYLADLHSGLGSWVGAFGALLAIWAAWLLARWEYRRDRRDAAARKRGEIGLISEIVSDFETKLMAGYVAALKTNDQEKLLYFTGFYNKHINDLESHSMRDLACAPVTVWPSLEVYAHFKQYWFISNEILRTSNTPGFNTTFNFSEALSDHETRFKESNDALQNAQKSCS